MLLSPLLLLALLSAACSGGSPAETPQPTEIVPNAGYSTAPIAVEIHGSRFLARATQQADGGAPALDTRHRAWLGDVELQDVIWVSTTALTATVPAGLPVGAQELTVESALGVRGTLDAAFTVLSAPSLSATVAVERTTVSEGQTFHLTLTVANDGSADVTDLALGSPNLSSSDGAEANASGTAPSAQATLAAGSSQTFTWTYVATKAGHLAATVGATGKDALFGETLTATPPAAAQVTVQTPPDLRAELSIPPSLAVSRTGVSNDFTVTVTIANDGGADALDVTPSAPAVVAGSTAAASLKAGTGATPASATVTAGHSVTFAWTYTAGTAIGSLQLSGGATGKDANSGATVTAAAAASNSAQVGNAAIIVTIKSAPAQAAIGQDFPVVVTFHNPGTDNVTTFRLSDPSVSSPDPTEVTLTGPSPAPPDPLQAGQNHAIDLTWTATTSVPGRLAITFTAIGRVGATTQAISGTATATIEVASP